MPTIRQAVLLAAGKGTRLLPRTAHVPKCLVEVAGRPILDYLLDSLRAVGVEELVVVTGYREERLRAHLERQVGLRIVYVDSPDFATTNNIVSLHRAAPHVAPPFYLLESDVWAPPDMLVRLSEPDSVAVSRYTESMDGTGVVTGDGGAIVRMILGAHELSPRPDGLMKTVNFYSISGAVWAGFAEGVRVAVERGERNAYYESILADLVTRGEVCLRAIDMSDLGWTEIDNLEDLSRAEQLAVVQPPRSS